MQTATVENRHSWKAPKRERVTIGRLTDPKGRVIFEGVSVVGKLATPHPLHGHLKKIVTVRIPQIHGGEILKQMKLKTAVQKGYYKVNADPKTKAAIEKTLEPLKNN